MTSTFATDGNCPEGGLIPCLDRAVAGLPRITSNQVPSCVTLVCKWSDVLFKSYPDWFIPLFTSSAGHRALVAFPQSLFGQIMDNINNETLMQFCLFFQSSLRPHPSDRRLDDGKYWSALFDRIPIAKLYEAITHYVHPDQESAVDLLQSQFPLHLTFSPLHQQYIIPPSARPKLFPTIDTTLFSPQFDWFVYLLSKYSPSEQFESCLDRIIKESVDTNSPTLLQPDFSIPDTFIHTNAFNSFDEFLSAKLPEISSHLDSPTSDDPTPTIDNPPLFSYFSKPHPCLPAPESRTPVEYAEITTTQDFQTHFVAAFILGTSLFSQQRPHFYTSINFVRYASQFNFWTDPSSESFEILRSSYLYRTHLLTTDIHHLTAHLNTIESQHLSSTSTSPIYSTPPTFTHPYFPLYLSLGSYSWVNDISIGDAVKPNFVSTSDIIQNLSSNCKSLVPVLLHILHHIPTDTNPIDAYIIALFQQPDFFSKFTTKVQLDDPFHTLGIFCDYFIARSYQRYLEGKDTLHQHLYHTMQTHPQLATTLEEPNSFHSLLLYPFPRYYYYDETVLPDKHIFLTIHAGFINFTPPTSSSLSLSLSPTIKSFSSHTLYRALAPVRSVIISYLINSTDLDSFFPPSERFQHQRMYQLIPYITNFKDLQFTSQPDHIMSLCIPSFLEPITNTIATSFPTIRSVRYDDLGRIHTISFRPDDCSDDTDDDLSCEHLYQQEFGQEFVEDASSTTQPSLEPSKFTPTISTTTQELISSDENVMALQSHQTTLLIKHFKAAAVTDLELVQSKLQHALLNSDLDGFLSSRSSTEPGTSSQSVNPFNAYPLPPPIHTPRTSKPGYRAQVADWSLELLIVSLLNLQPPQPLRTNQRASSTLLPTTITNAPSRRSSSAATNAFFKNPSTLPRSSATGKAALLPRLRQTIMSMLRLPSYSRPHTVQSDFYDTMISCALSPMLRIFDVLAALPGDHIPLQQPNTSPTQRQNGQRPPPDASQTSQLDAGAPFHNGRHQRPPPPILQPRPHQQQARHQHDAAPDNLDNPQNQHRDLNRRDEGPNNADLGQNYDAPLNLHGPQNQRHYQNQDNEAGDQHLVHRQPGPGHLHLAHHPHALPHHFSYPPHFLHQNALPPPQPLPPQYTQIPFLQGRSQWDPLRPQCSPRPQWIPHPAKPDPGTAPPHLPTATRPQFLAPQHRTPSSSRHQLVNPACSGW